MRILRAVALCDKAGSFDITLDGDRVGAITSAAEGSQPQWLALPSLVNLHAHANRAFSAPAGRTRSFAGSVEAAKRERASATTAEIQQRASRFFRRSIVHGVSRVRTHTDVDPVTGMRAVEGVLAAASEVASALDVDIVAFANSAADPVLPSTRALLTEAVRRGASLIGAVPALYAAPAQSLDAVLELAVALDVGVDLHLDEHLDVGAALIERLVDATLQGGLTGRVTVSHACALSAMPADRASRLLERMAEAKITLVVLPELNLYLQGRTAGSPRERGIAPVALALRAGVTVRFGTDNVRDWFFPFGDADPLTTAYVGALATHVDAPEDLTSLICGGRTHIAIGEVADLVLVPASSLDDAIGRRPAGRLLLRGGRRVGAEFDEPIQAKPWS
jgi:cytosine/creatinine deaminase